MTETPLIRRLIKLLWLLLISLFLFPLTALAASSPSDRLQAPQIVSDADMCSCVRYTRLLIPELPTIATPAALAPNAIGGLGDAVLFDYNEAHIATIIQVLSEGFVIAESNFHHCRLSTRYIRWDDPHIRGFWAPVDKVVAHYL